MGTYFTLNSMACFEAINFIKFPVFGPVYISEVWITRLELMQQCYSIQHV